jgi:hypothetical protein
VTRIAPSIQQTIRRPLSTRVRNALAVAALLAAVALVPSSIDNASASPHGVGGEAGTVQALAATSPLTVSEPNSGSGSPYPNLKVTVNQTQNLVNQDVSVSWTGGVPTTSDTTFNADYLQIFECWGDPVNPNGADPGPPPSQCEFGGESSTPTTSYPIESSIGGFQYSRVLSESAWSSYPALSDCAANAPSGSPACQVSGYGNLYDDTKDGFVIDPFQAVDGTTIGQQANYNFDADPLNPVPFWQNPYFSFETTNEVDFARTYSGGSGQQLFQVDTGLEAPGLGCGQDIEPTAAGGTTTPQCWLVVVPRSVPADENPSNVQLNAVATSPLTPSAWANRIAIPLKFNPVGSSCAINAATEGIEGSELASEAVSSWQPALCGQSSSTSYSYLENSDDQARQNLAAPTYGSVGMSVFTDPIDPSQTASTNPVTYAPLTLSGVAVGFNIERVPANDGTGPYPDEIPLSGTQVATVNLTPRLVAKLLTESYKGQFEDISATKPASGYDWVENNPLTLFSDPDFLQYNPEFAELTTQQQVDSGTLLVEETNSDAASTLWKWVLSDPEALAWLNGTPTPTGVATANGQPGEMYVNPDYSTNPNYQYNTSHSVFGSPTPESFPKSDPYCESLSGTEEPPIGGAPAKPLCFLDWSPYAASMEAASQDASAANDQSKTTYNPTATSAQSAWSSNGPQVAGTYVVMTVTDTASAARYGLQAASLSRSGDDSPQPNRLFVAPNTASLLAGEQGMTASSVSGVLQPNPSTDVPGAYPLTMLTYAAATPETLAPADRSSYAAFIRYAVQAGQTSGTAPGQLPAGYVPLPAALKSQALSAASTILNPPVETTASAKTATSQPPSATKTTVGPTAALPESATPVAAGDQTSSSTTTSATAAPSRAGSLGPAALSSERVPSIAIGIVRWMVPIGLLVGLVAALAGLFTDRLHRRRSVAVTGSDPPAGGGRS